MECSLKGGSTFNLKVTERLEAVQHRAKLTNLSSPKTAEINSLPY